MSIESASRFLEDVTYRTELREKFRSAGNPHEFVKVAQELGYDFTTEELHEVVSEHSKGVTVRRQTGVWQWLRTVNWMTR
ncbi:MAG: Nif11-like leader peptide family natural product precursor [Desertifilum sp. SIO1I2]|nr:Nif11-like leader peptide family natural product precursor [Desertifilum sp. SIO1I2]